MIPKVIHYCWLGGGRKPARVERCIASWHKVMPDYEIKEWNETNYDFTKQPYMEGALRAKKWAFVSDYARLDIIYTYGGIYLDTDVEALRPFDSLLGDGAFCGFESKTKVNLGQGFGAEVGNLAIKAMRDAYDDKVFVNNDGTLNLVAQPNILSETLARMGLQNDNGNVQRIGCMTVYPRDYFNPKNMSSGRIEALTEHTFSIHHFDASWFTPRQKFIKWIVQHIGLWPARVASLCMHNPIYIFRRAAEFLKNRA